MFSRFSYLKNTKKYCSLKTLKDKLTKYKCNNRSNRVKPKHVVPPANYRLLSSFFKQKNSNETCSNKEITSEQLNEIINRINELIKSQQQPKSNKEQILQAFKNVASKSQNILSGVFLRQGMLAAAGAATQSNSHIEQPLPIPEAPASLIAFSLFSKGEPSFESLGLGGYGPVGLVQSALAMLHISLGIPWWGAIAIGTLVVRMLMFPLVILAQRNGAKMNNYMPQIQMLQLKMTEARQTGNHLEAARYGQEMMLFMKEKNLNPLKNLIVPLAQMPLFVSFFVGLRQMANCPVDSLKTGGMLWFTDLTLPDQFFLLPIITSATMFLTIEIGTDSAKLSAQNLQVMKYFLRAVPLIILPFTINFPGAILCYWTCSNFISLAQVGILRIPKVREYFKIEKMVTHNPDNLPVKPKGFIKGLKDSWSNIKITNELEGRKRYDEMQFQRAGKGPIVKTYKFDPTKSTTMRSEAYSTKK